MQYSSQARQGWIWKLHIAPPVQGTWHTRRKNMLYRLHCQTVQFLASRYQILKLKMKNDCRLFVYKGNRSDTAECLRLTGAVSVLAHQCTRVCMLLLLCVKSCTFWSVCVQPFSHHLRPCIWAMLNRFSTVERILYSFLSILCQALAKISYKVRRTRIKNSEVFSELTVKLAVILDVCSQGSTDSTCALHIFIFVWHSCRTRKLNSGIILNDCFKSHGKHIFF